jgi:hypothetical protein
MTTFIFDNTVAVFFWKEQPIVILIKDKDYAKTNRNYFDQLWKTAKNRKNHKFYSPKYELQL